MGLRFDKDVEGNYSFIKELFFTHKMRELQIESWSQDILLPLLEMQFNSQRSSYKRQYPNAEEYIVYMDELPVGWLILDNSQSYHIVNIMVHEAYRGNNIGSEIVRDVLCKADREGKQVTLFVEKNNPAQKLYSRLGFKIQTSDELFLKMAT